MHAGVKLVFTLAAAAVVSTLVFAKGPAAPVPSHSLSPAPIPHLARPLSIVFDPGTPRGDGRTREILMKEAKEEVRRAYSACLPLSKKSFTRQARLVYLLWVGLEYLEKCGVTTYWIDYGTLMGAVRDSFIMIQDRDVDLSVTEAGYRQLSDCKTDFLAKHGCRWVDNSYKHPGKKGVVRCDWVRQNAKPKRYELDVYGYKDNGTHLTTSTLDGCKLGFHDPEKPCLSCPVPHHLILPLNCSGTLHSRGVCQPNKPIDLLQRYYGSITRTAVCFSLCCSENTTATDPGPCSSSKSRRLKRRKKKNPPPPQ